MALVLDLQAAFFFRSKIHSQRPLIPAALSANQTQEDGYRRFVA